MFMSWWFLEVLLSKMGSSKGPHSATLYCLCIDEIVNKAAKEEGLDGPKLMHELIFILFYLRRAFHLEPN